MAVADAVGIGEEEIGKAVVKLPAGREREGILFIVGLLGILFTGILFMVDVVFSLWFDAKVEFVAWVLESVIVISTHPHCMDRSSTLSLSWATFRANSSASLQ